MDKTVNITNFIGVYDNYITPEECARKLLNYMKNKINLITQ